jgi:uncharacterized protein (DUF2236 family)
VPLIPTPTTLAARAFPDGIPGVREQVQARTGLFTSALDPAGTPGDAGLFGPGSPTWEVVGQPCQALAGLRAALLQALSAPIPTATDATGTFAHDFAGRVSRTGAFVQLQNLGSMQEVHRSARRVRAMHRTVVGTAKDGLEYDAGDPHQQAWVSMTLTDSMLVMADRYGHGLRGQRADRFVREQSTHGALLDPRVDLDGIFADPDARAALQAGTLPLPLLTDGELPTTVAELRELMGRFTGELFATARTRSLLDAAVQLGELPPRQRAAVRPFVLAVLATVPDEWHELLAPGERRVEEHLAAQAIQTPMALLRLLVGRSPAIEVARRRAAGDARLADLLAS